MNKNISSKMKFISILACTSILTFNYALANYAFKKKIKIDVKNFFANYSKSELNSEDDSIFTRTL